MKNETSIIAVQLAKEDLTGSKAEMIRNAFAPMADMLEGFESEYNTIIAKPITKELCVEARELRLRLVKVRTGTAKVHKEQKAEHLRAGRAIDAVKNILEYAVVDKEEALKKIELHYENIEKEAKEALRVARLERLKPYGFENSTIDLSGMSEQEYETFFIGAKTAHETKLSEEKKAKEEAEAKRLAEEAEKARLKKENEDLNKKVKDLLTNGIPVEAPKTVVIGAEKPDSEKLLSVAGQIKAIVYQPSDNEDVRVVYQVVKDHLARVARYLETKSKQFK